jgi:hypothetical protein
VRETGDLAVHDLGVGAVLEDPDDAHLAIRPQQLLSGQ